MTTLFEFLALLGMAWGVLLLLAICVISFWSARAGEHEWKQEVIEREMRTAPPEPVHEDLLEEIRRQGGYDIAKDRPMLTEDDMEAVREACRGCWG